MNKVTAVGLGPTNTNPSFTRPVNHSEILPSNGLPEEIETYAYRSEFKGYGLE
jgi:hypothetical protein